jgi:hypothetical protein
LKILKRRVVKSPRNRRDSVEELENALETPWMPHEREREERGFAKLGFNGVLNHLI